MNNNYNNQPNNFFGQPQQMQQPMQQMPPQMQQVPGYGYPPMGQPQYGQQAPYMMPPQGYGYGYPQMGQPPRAPQFSGQPMTPEGAWNSYSGSIDAEEKLDKLDEAIDLINSNVEATTESLGDADLAETLANRAFDGILIQMEKLANEVGEPEKWFPKSKANMAAKFKPSLEKLASGLKTYVKNLKMI